jgi:NADPH2:quinone reductase
MKAIIVRAVGGPEVLKLEDAPDPTPGPGQVLIRVRAAGVNPLDTYIRAGANGRTPQLPYTPGSDAAGVVERVGAGVSRFHPGDRVYAYSVAGSYAELVACSEAVVLPLPERASFPEGAAMGVPYATAWRALFLRAAARPGETVLVHGASGGVGTAAIQLARARGLNVIGTAGTAEGLKLVSELGAHHALSHRDPGYLAQIKPLTDGRGVDVVLEMLANVNLDHDLDVLAPHGRVVVIGSRGRIEIDPRKVMANDAAILGTLLLNAPPAELREVHAGLVAGLENGSLKPVIGKEFPLADAAKAHAAVLEPGALGKIVLLP